MIVQNKNVLMRETYNKLIQDDAMLEGAIDHFCETYLKDRLDRPMKLRPFQKIVVKGALMNPRLVLLAPRGSGKSYAIAIAVVFRLFFLREHELVAVIAPTNRQARGIFEYVVKFMQSHPELSRLIDSIRNINPTQITMVTGSKLVCLSVSKSNHGENVRGIHPTYCIVDESAFIPDDIFQANVEPIVVANKANFIHITTPGPKNNHIYKYLYDEKYSSGWERMKFNYYQVMEQGEAYEAAYPIIKEYANKEHPHGRTEPEFKRDTWGQTSPMFRREYMCEFDDDETDLFTERVFEKTFYKLPMFQVGAENEYNVMTVDFAQRHNSTTYALWRIHTRESGENVAFLIDIQEMILPTGKGELLHPDIQRNDILIYAKFNHVKEIIIDATAYGDTFALQLDSELRNKMRDIKLTQFKFSNKKAAWYIKYKYMMNDEKVKIPDPSLLQDDSHRELVHKAIHQHKILSLTMSEQTGNAKVTKERHERDDIADSMMMISVFLTDNPRYLDDIQVTFTSNPSRNRPSSYGMVIPKRINEATKNFKKGGLRR